MPERVLGMIVVAFAVALPLFPVILPVLLVALVLTVLWSRSQTSRVACSLTWRTALPWMVLVYALHLLGLLWTTNMDFAGLDLGIKAPLLAFPVILCLGGRVNDHKPALRAFVLANIVAIIFSLIRASVISGVYIQQVGPNEVTSSYTATEPFFASSFSAFLHPTYMAMYCTIALVFLASEEFKDLLSTIWKRIASVTLLIGIVLCASRAGWVIAVIVGAYLMIIGRDRRSAMKLIMTGTVALIIGGAALFFSSEIVRERIMQVVNVLYSSGQNDATPNSASDRVQVWTSAVSLISKAPFTGVGTGDVKDAMIAEYTLRGYQDPLEKRLNAHDQFLNTAVALGVIAASIVLLMLLVPMLEARRNNGVLFAFFLIMALNWTVESMLEVQAGVMCFAFFTWFFYKEPG